MLSRARPRPGSFPRLTPTPSFHTLQPLPASRFLHSSPLPHPLSIQLGRTLSTRPVRLLRLDLVRSRFNSTQSRPPTSNGGFPNDSEPKKGKIARAWSTPTRWYHIPLALGALVLVAVQWRRQSGSSDEPEVTSQGTSGAVVRSKIDGPWQVRILGALPLRSMSRLWGYLNSLVLPTWFRPFGFTLYGTIFGCNLDEVPRDLVEYESLGEFFYRELKPGARPIADAPMVSPADGKVLHFGEIVGEKVEQVKGLTYSLDALLGVEGKAFGERAEIDRSRSSSPTSSPPPTPSPSATPATDKDGRTQVVDDEHFAEINQIPYSLSSLLGRSRASEVHDRDADPDSATEHDASHPPDGQDLAHDASVALKIGASAATQTATDKRTELTTLSPKNKLFFLVVYLAPGDYHRFHSPCAWVVERRRHFTGDLFSVSPYIANRLRDLFVLNERVALLGRWRHGFYSFVPVGATNVGSILINFDESLRTNTRQMSHPPHTFTEAVYSSASVLKGQPLLPGEEMGGFKLGSTIVMVFEAPGDWKFDVSAGEKVKVGQALGHFEKTS